ncbi:MAG: hypothetical protein KTR21_01955 [Rhodobacteraceae bacterium]|nr:hypothetical protein [Paracoccaceae bacterium]
MDQTCVPVFACIEPLASSENLTFTGRAKGQIEGAISGQLSNGVNCKATWRALADGRGRVENGDCEDGRQFEADYSFLDPETNTIMGQGLTNLGERITAWSGPDLHKFFERRGADPTVTKRCGAPFVS